MKPPLPFALKSTGGAMFRLTLYALSFIGVGLILVVFSEHFAWRESTVIPNLAGTLMILVAIGSVTKIYFTWNTPIAQLTEEGIFYPAGTTIRWQDIKTIERYSVVGTPGFFVELKPEVTVCYGNCKELAITLPGVSNHDMTVAYEIIQSILSSK